MRRGRLGREVTEESLRDGRKMGRSAGSESDHAYNGYTHRTNRKPSAGVMP